jgi:hypothetical protein
MGDVGLEIFVVREVKKRYEGGRKEKVRKGKKR